MKFAKARRIPVQYLVEKLYGWYSHTDSHGNLWYHSPFRPTEETASFKINVKLNKWHDFGHSHTVTHPGEPNGGDILDLWCDYHFKDRRGAVNEALQALEDFGLFVDEERVQQERGIEIPAIHNKKPTFQILKIAEKITHYGLKQELQRRKVSEELANLYLKQGHILNTRTNRQYYAFLFPNDKGGYEVSIPNPRKENCFKTSIGAKGSSYLSPSDESDTGEVMEGFWDALSWLEIKKIKKPIHHTFVLNSNSFANEVVRKIIAREQKLKFVFLFLDNDVSGRNATHAMTVALEPHIFVIGSMETLYEGFKDLNEYYKMLP